LKERMGFEMVSQKIEVENSLLIARLDLVDGWMNGSKT
jgi:hypothetical protein